MRQPDLFDDDDIPPHQRHSETSRDSALLAKPKFPATMGAVLERLLARGARGATDEELQLALGMSGNTERPARVTLTARGMVADSGTTRKTLAGRNAVVWIATDAAEQEMLQ